MGPVRRDACEYLPAHDGLMYVEVTGSCLCTVVLHDGTVAGMHFLLFHYFKRGRFEQSEQSGSASVLKAQCRTFTLSHSLLKPDSDKCCSCCRTLICVGNQSTLGLFILKMFF